MPNTLNEPEAHATPHDGAESHIDRLQHIIDHVAHFLPAQGPIKVFIHHNTMHAFEHLTFHEALRQGSRIFGNEPYLQESQYRTALAQGRIRTNELQDVLREDLGERGRERIAGVVTRFELRFAMLQYPVWTGTSDEMRWLIEETDSLRQLRPEASAANRVRLTAETRHWVMRDLRSCNEENGHSESVSQGSQWLPQTLRRFSNSAIESWSDETWDEFTLELLWNICCDGLKCAPPPEPAPLPIRHRDLLVAISSTDTDLWVNDLLVRFCAAFLDQGFSQWELPDREQGFYQAFINLFQDAIGPPHRWMKGISSELARITQEGIEPLQLIHESLVDLGVPESEWEDYLISTLLALRGWGGMVRQVEIRADSVAHAIPAGSLVEMLAIRLLLDRCALKYAGRHHLGFDGPLSDLRDLLRSRQPRPEEFDTNRRAFLIFMMAQVLGWTPHELFALGKSDWIQLIEEVELFSEFERRRIFHTAYEVRFRTRTLDALAIRAAKAVRQKSIPSFQSISCLDEREESFRRHLEEIAPNCETFGAAGFFNVPMYYRGAADAHFVPLCPIVIRPQHWVAEHVDNELESLHQQRSKTRQTLGKAAHHVHVGSRGFALGAMVTAGFGVFASIPLLSRILFPLETGKVRRWFGKYVQTPSETRLCLERTETSPGTENGHLGYSVEEMTNMAERLMRDSGLTSRFARLVFVLGHGSNSMNNPHRSAYDCGACGGSWGGPNARAWAQIANDPRIRRGLAQRGIVIPDETFFVGAFHNTCDDSVTLMDTDRVPETHREEFAYVSDVLRQACERNAHERCRRFMSAPLTISRQSAKEHVEGRSENLAEPRPELGHATNAICIIGRRYRTRGLFLDRRAFLISYDPLQDSDDAMVMTRILQAVVPVCAGINLEYYFSRVDSAGWGCGTKLPHNITSLLGVMDGASSDLRTGLPWQMVEIHEPVRLLFVLEIKAETALSILDRNPGFRQVFLNGWVQLAVLDPTSAEIQLFHNGKFQPYEAKSSELPQRESSIDWYRGWRDHLEFAEIVPTKTQEAVAKAGDIA